MTEPLQTTLRHLAALVGFDTRNPPRAITTGGIFAYLMEALPGFRFDLCDHGAGAVSLLATRGTPDLLFNVHIDTVPDAPGWSGDPFTLRVTDDRAIGLGACDIKGAAAAFLTAAAATDGDAAFLFSSDEEANDARCIAAFLARDHGFRRVVVAEPTSGKAVLAHRGIASVQVDFSGIAGHASNADARDASAVHQAMRWGVAALALAQDEDAATFGDLNGLRFNIGRIEGGIKGNIIAPACGLRANFRPLPSHDVDALHARLKALSPAPSAYGVTFAGPSLPAIATDSAPRRAAAATMAAGLGLEIGRDVDFWTEAALFSAAGLDAVVCGPGNILQAHSVDEWVALDQLAAYSAAITRILSGP